MPYNTLGSYFKRKYGCRLKKICIDAGFTCPNRDGRCGVGGCIFCGERGAGEHIKGGEIRKQVTDAIARAQDGKFIAYFQNFTNTYADLDTLKRRYDEALSDERIVALAIGTRPDCITDEIAELIASYKDCREVWVELGLQTSSDKTAKIINRGYDSEVFTRAVEILNRHGIPIVAHMMIGLPSEGEAEVKQTVRFLAGHRLWGVKIHSLYVMRGTRLATLYESGEYEPISMDEYVTLATYTITHLPSDVIIHRVTGDCPKGMLLAPHWSADKNAVINAIRQRLSEGGLYQGIYYNQE